MAGSPVWWPQRSHTAGAAGRPACVRTEAAQGVRPFARSPRGTIRRRTDLPSARIGTSGRHRRGCAHCPPGALVCGPIRSTFACRITSTPYPSIRLPDLHLVSDGGAQIVKTRPRVGRAPPRPPPSAAARAARCARPFALRGAAVGHSLCACPQRSRPGHPPTRDFSSVCRCLVGATPPRDVPGCTWWWPRLGQ